MIPLWQEAQFDPETERWLSRLLRSHLRSGFPATGGLEVWLEVRHRAGFGRRPMTVRRRVPLVATSEIVGVSARPNREERERDLAQAHRRVRGTRH